MDILSHNRDGRLYFNGEIEGILAKVKVKEKAFVIPVALILFVTVCVRIWDLDMVFQNLFWDKEGGFWKYAGTRWVQWVYGAGVLPALVVGVPALCLLLFGIGRPDLAVYRKVSGYLLAVLLLGSGVVANLLLKGLWGRPRPSQVEDFGGKYPFEPVLLYDHLSDGKSFVCGHATMGFFFFAVALVIPRKYVGWRTVTMVFALALGALLGWVRMAQGGHFFSDVIWAGGVMWVMAWGLFHLFRLHESRLYLPKHEFKRRVPTWAFVGYAPVIALGMFVGLLGTPYERSEAAGNFGRDVVRIRFDAEGEVKIKEGDVFAIRSRIQGFGVPNSSFQYHYDLLDDGTLLVASKRKGFFTELRPILEVTIPAGSELPIAIRQ